VFPEARKLLPAEVVVDAHKRRNLTLITKIIQNISNQVAFGSKEAYMIPLNPLLEDYKKKNEEFMLKTCLDKNIITEYQKEAYRHVQEAYANKIVTSDPSLLKEIQNIHSILQKNKDRILKALDESGVHENLSPLFESILRKLPPLTPIIIKKPLPPTPQINKDVENASTEKTDGDNERYKRLLEKAQTIDDRDLEAMNILTIRGTDKEGRPIVVFTEEHVRKEDLDRVLYYIVKKLDKVVEKNYVMIWCVNNSSSQNRPGFNWLLNVYRSLSRKYKKNLKSFYLIHPTFMFKVIIKCFRPFVSDKFWKKLHLCDRLSQLYVDIDKETLPLPPSILTYDFLLNKESSDMNPVFGVSLSELMSRPENKGETIPKFLKHLMDHIRQHGMNAQGLFRLSGNVTEVNKVKILLNNNDNVDLCHCDIHTIATILKQFFREMPEPLFTYECYDGFLNILQNINQVDNAINNHSYITPMKNMLNKLPHVNFLVCKELFSLLVQTSLNSEENKMTSHNLAIVFGPNILRSKSENAISALQDNSQVTKVVDFIIQEYTNLFMSQSISRRGRPNNIRCSTLIEQFNNHA
jgi:Rho GTPase-activating protein 1